jgi:hypothetical protein
MYSARDRISQRIRADVSPTRFTTAQGLKILGECENAPTETVRSIADARPHFRLAVGLQFVFVRNKHIGNMQ